MILIDRRPSPPTHADLAGKTRDTLPLSWEGRRWTRRKAVTASGREIALAFPTGTVLDVGSVLFVGDDWYLEVEGVPEPVIAVAPRSGAEALRIAFEVGNRHFSIALDGASLLVPDDTAMVQLLDRLGVAWTRREAVYSPMGFGNPHGNDHGHSHGHAHESPHDHGHEHGPSHDHAFPHEH